jgi:hypothetical protein
MKSVLLLSFLFATNAIAVPVKDCPSRLAVTASLLEVTKPLDQLLAKLSKDSDLNDEKLESVRVAYGNLNRAKKIKGRFSLVAARNGRCTYGDKEQKSPQSNEKIEVYTKNGEDIVYLQRNIGPQGILVRIYGKLDRFSEQELALKPRHGRIALAIPRGPYTSYSVGGPLVAVGKSDDLRISTR